MTETLPTAVVHCKGRIKNFGRFIYCGRPSKWGNSFVVGKDGTRDDVVSKHARWLAAPEQKELLASVVELRGKICACWCHPKRCHCDTLAAIADLPNFTIAKARRKLLQIADRIEASVA